MVPYYGTSCEHYVYVGGCIPGSARLQTKQGERLARDITVGDSILTPSGWEYIYFMGHADDTKLYPFIEIRLSTGRIVSLSPNHYISADGELRTAKRVTVNMTVLVEAADGNGELSAVVVAVKRTEEKGAFNPYTIR
jgi:hypothetical protein